MRLVSLYLELIIIFYFLKLDIKILNTMIRKENAFTHVVWDSDERIPTKSKNLLFPPSDNNPRTAFALNFTSSFRRRGSTAVCLKKPPHCISLNSRLVSDTFIFVAISSRKKLLMAFSSSTSSVFGLISRISTSMWGIRWRTDPPSLTTPWKAESSVPLSSTAHLRGYPSLEARISGVFWRSIKKKQSNF